MQTYTQTQEDEKKNENEKRERFKIMNKNDLKHKTKIFSLQANQYI